MQVSHFASVIAAQLKIMKLPKTNVWIIAKCPLSQATKWLTNSSLAIPDILLKVDYSALRLRPHALWLTRFGYIPYCFRIHGLTYTRTLNVQHTEYMYMVSKPGGKLDNANELPAMKDSSGGSRLHCKVLKTLGKNLSKTSFQLRMKLKETKQKWKRAKRLPKICKSTQQMSSSLLAFLHFCLVSILFPAPSLTEIKF